MARPSDPAEATKTLPDAVEVGGPEAPSLDQVLRGGALLGLPGAETAESPGETESPEHRLTAVPRLSVVMPVYNEEAVILETHQRISGLLAAYAKRGAIRDYEIVYVDDGSHDGTLPFLRIASAGNPAVKVVSFSRNFGHQPALTAGLLQAGGDAVVTLDADLQDPPELIETMLAKYREGYDIVYAARKARPKDTIFKKTVARLFYKGMLLMGAKIIYDCGDYRLVSRRVIEEFRKFPEVNVFLRGIFPFMGFPHTVVYFDRAERVAGEAKYSFWKLAHLAWEGVTSFSTVPLKMASYAGFLAATGSLGLAAWALYGRLTEKIIPGWASIVIPVFFIGGLNLLFLGLIGEYIAKTYAEVKRRPVFIVREKINCT